MKPPLDGMRVLDFTAVIGAPYGTMMLAGMGAEVIRLESRQRFPPTTRGTAIRPVKELVPSMGPVGRGYPNFDPGERPWNRFALFNCHAHSKLSATADLGTPRGVETAKDLIALSDVLVENQPGVLERYGLSYETARKVRPDLIWMSISGMGASGPYRDLRGYGGHFENLAGVSWLRGSPNNHPLSNTTVVASDPASGAALAWLAAALVHRRALTGEGRYVDMAMAELYLHQLAPAYLDYAMNGRVQRTLGNGHSYYAPHGVYPCAGDDSWVTISVTNDAEWGALRKVMGDPAWARSRSYADGYRRSRRNEELDRQLAEWTKGWEHVELQNALQAAGVPAGAVLDDAEIYDDPHLRQRGFYRRIEHAEAGVHDYPFELWRMSKTGFELRGPPPLLGEHNGYCYHELLGLSDEEYRRLEAAGHIGMDYVEPPAK